MPIVSILREGFETSIKLWNYIGKVELVDKVERWDILFVVFQGVVDSWWWGRWRGNLFNERHSRLGFADEGGSGCLLGEVVLGFIVFQDLFGIV